MVQALQPMQSLRSMTIPFLAISTPFFIDLDPGAGIYLPADRLHHVPVEGDERVVVDTFAPRDLLVPGPLAEMAAQGPHYLGMEGVGDPHRALHLAGLRLDAYRIAVLD